MKQKVVNIAVQYINEYSTYAYTCMEKTINEFNITYYYYYIMYKLGIKW